MSSHPRRRLEHLHSDCTGSKDQGMTVREVFDLHGYTKTEAIQAMTVFFDAIRSRNQPISLHGRKYMVEIITGTGQHSSHGMFVAITP
jgi:DNA-nicking Smr family endonuclease